MNRTGAITTNSSVSIALVLSMCGGAFWTGYEISGLKTSNAITRERVDKIETLTETIAELARTNKVRLDHREER